MPKITYTKASAVYIYVLILDNNKLDRFRTGTTFKTFEITFLRNIRWLNDKGSSGASTIKNL
jgi:hypothetical protein